MKNARPIHALSTRTHAAWIENGTSYPRYPRGARYARATHADEQGVDSLVPFEPTTSNIFETLEIAADRLVEGASYSVKGRRYVCIGWEPWEGRYGPAVLLRFWGECRHCGAGFHANVTRTKARNGDISPNCPAHRGMRS